MLCIQTFGVSVIFINTFSKDALIWSKVNFIKGCIVVSTKILSSEAVFNMDYKKKCLDSSVSLSGLVRQRSEWQRGDWINFSVTGKLCTHEDRHIWMLRCILLFFLCLVTCFESMSIVLHFDDTSSLNRMEKFATMKFMYGQGVWLIAFYEYCQFNRAINLTRTPEFTFMIKG